MFMGIFNICMSIMAITFTIVICVLFLLLIGLIYGLCYIITIWIPNKEQKKVDKELERRHHG